MHNIPPSSSHLHHWSKACSIKNKKEENKEEKEQEAEEGQEEKEEDKVVTLLSNGIIINKYKRNKITNSLHTILSQEYPQKHVHKLLGLQP